MRKWVCLLALLIATSGCVINGIRGEYGTLTTMVYPPKGDQDEVLLLTSRPQRPYKEVGIISVKATRSPVALDVMNAEIVRLAKQAGADAVIILQYSGSVRNGAKSKGEAAAVITRKQVYGTAIVYTDKAAGP